MLQPSSLTQRDRRLVLPTLAARRHFFGVPPVWIFMDVEHSDPSHLNPSSFPHFCACPTGCPLPSPPQAQFCQGHAQPRRFWNPLPCCPGMWVPMEREGPLAAPLPSPPSTPTLSPQHAAYCMIAGFRLRVSIYSFF